MALIKHLPGKYGYSCIDCKHYLDNYSDIFGSCPTCEHEPRPVNINEVFEGDEPCEFFNFNVYIPKYKFMQKRDVYGKLRIK